MAMDKEEHTHLEEWARQYGGTAILGFICTLLIGGKFLHHVLHRRGLICGALIVPPAMLSGILGLIWFSVMDKVDPEITNDLSGGLEAVKGNLINFVFAALILGLTCARTKSHHTTVRGVVTSLLHEGMPMVIYSQVLMWGQSTCCLAVLCLLNAFGAQIPKGFAAMVPLGVEAGADVVVKTTANSDHFWSATVVEEAESLGLCAACVGTGQAEAFERGKKPSNLKHSSSTPNLQVVIENTEITLPEHHNTLYRGDKRDRDKQLRENNSNNGGSSASLGAHLSLIALTVFLSFGVALFARLVEIELNITHRMVSGIRMFKLSMCCALFSMMFLLRRSRIRFNRDWFMRLCGLMLDLLFIAALSKAYPKPKNLEETHYAICGLFVLVCCLWNGFCFLFVARSIFPNFWFERGLVLTADALGHSYCGLLFARTLDPSMESPVPAAYAYKLMLFFIPSSGGKNSVVLGILGHHGPWAALIVSLCVVATWMVIFTSHFRDRFLPNPGSSQRDIFPFSTSNAFLVGLGLGSPPPTKSSTPLLSPSTIDTLGISSAGDDNEALLNALSFDSQNEVLGIDGPKGLVKSEGGRGKASPEDTSLSSNVGDSPNRVISKPPRKQAKAPGSGGHGSSSSMFLEANAVGVLGEYPDSGDGLGHGMGGVHLDGRHVHASEGSTIMTQMQMDTIAQWLPDTRSARSWTLKYSLRRDGASLDTLLSLCCTVDFRGMPTHSASIIVVQDSWGYIFGGYIAHALEHKGFYYGNGESFVFSLAGVNAGTSTNASQGQCYKWTGANNLFVVSDSNCFAMGGGGDGFAFQLDDELDTGVSNRSATYNNGQLSSSEFFKCLNLEVWLLDSVSLDL